MSSSRPVPAAGPVPRRRLAVLISGRGSNLQALLDAAADPGYPAEVALVIANRADAAGLARAAAAGVATQVIEHRRFADRAAFDQAIDTALRAARIDLVCLAGFMRLFTAGFVTAWQDRLMNIHPALLPAFKGLHVHGEVLASGARVTGCTVHFVRPEMDAGPIILQAVVAVEDGDDPDRLAARVLAAEHRAYPEAVRLVAEGRAQVAGNRVVLDGATGVLLPTSR